EPGTIGFAVQYANHYTKGVSPCTEVDTGLYSFDG
ncbi:unnamed protein product, partial [Larinioides sclopetarius]